MEVIADKLVAPWSIAFLPDGRVLVTERAGRVRIIKDKTLQPEPALVVPDIKAWVKMGLLGIVLDPHFESNHFVYLAESYGGEGERDSWVRVVRNEMQGDKLVSPTKLIDQIPAFLNHAGGRLAFGPDGKLYITTGDADRPPQAQDLKSLSGKILRVNADGSIPSDNPFVNDPNANPAVWSYGHRNPQGLAFERSTGTLYAPEHGPDGGDEINLIRGGRNYGWPTVAHDRTADGITPSLAEFSPAIGPGDATFYDGEMFPEFKGELLVACMRGEAVLRVSLGESGQKIVRVERLLHHKIGRIREVKVAPDGAIWITTSEIDPPEGRNNPGYDQVIRLTPESEPATQTPARPVGGVALYAANCASCHGTSTERGTASNLFDKQWQYGRRDIDIRSAIHDGAFDPEKHAFGKTLADEEIEELLRFVRIREANYRE